MIRQSVMAKGWTLADEAGVGVLRTVNPYMKKKCCSGKLRWTFIRFWCVKQAITVNIVRDSDVFLPVLQVEQVKKGCFRAIYEDNVWKVKPDSNDQNRKTVIEFLFLKWSQNAVCKRKGITGLFLTSGCNDIQPFLLQFLNESTERFSCNIIYKTFTRG